MYLPKLQEHFMNEGMPDSLWLQKWFQSLFLYSMPFGLVLRIWDNLFAYGSRYLFQVAIAILTLLEDTLLERDME